jgi:ligand-binding SRPBCC domain-containing protein
MSHMIEREQFVPRPLSEVFAFFSDAANLGRLTPPKLHFKILSTLPIAMHPGAVIDYRISLFGIPFRWRTLIESFDVARQFIDVQLRGPYRSWRHVHDFEAVSGGTRMRDRVDYELPLGPLGEVASAIFVTRQVEDIFDFRRAAIQNIFASRGQRHEHA